MVDDRSKARKPRVYGFAKFLGLCFGLLAAGPAQAEWDTGTSHTLFLKAKLNDAWFVTSRSNAATREGVDDLFFGFADINVGYKLSAAWSAEIGYRHARLELQSGWRDEYRPLANLMWRQSVRGWVLSNRHRLEFRFFEGDTTDDRVRYRNHTRVEFPWEIPVLGVRPYIEEEAFFEFTDAGFNANWLTGGVSLGLAKGLKVKLGYRWQAQQFGDSWNHRHVLVSGLSWIF